MVRFIVTLALATSAIGAEPAKDGGLGEKVRKFAKDNLGEKVDDGECALLAMRALESAGAKTTSDFKVTGEVGDYVWGKLVEKYDDAKPGDIIQFRDVKIVSTMVVKQPGGGTRTSTRSQTMTQHTAIISANLGKGKFKVLEQNVGLPGADEKARKVVQENTIDLGDKTEGKVWIYRPVAK